MNHESKDPWNYPERKPVLEPGRYEAWVNAADSSQFHRDCLSAAAWEIREAGKQFPAVTECMASRLPDSDETRGVIAAVAGVVESLSPSSTVTIYSRISFIVDAINGDVDGWKGKGGRETSIDKRIGWDIWKRYIRVRDERRLTVKAVLRSKKDCKRYPADYEILTRLRSEATEKVQATMAEMNIGPGGFGIVA